MLKNTDIITLDCRNADSPDFAPSRDQAEIQAPRSANFKQKFRVPYPAVANRIDSKPAVVKQKHGASRPVAVKQKLGSMPRCGQTGKWGPTPRCTRTENGASYPSVVKQKLGLHAPPCSNRIWGFAGHTQNMAPARLTGLSETDHAGLPTCCEENFKAGFTLLRKSKSRPLCLSVQK